MMTLMWFDIGLLLLLLATPSHAYGDGDTVALIIGGLSKEVAGDETPVPVESVELFGCEGYERSSYIVNDYPTKVYMAAGAWSDGAVVSCGGMSCTDNAGVCQATSECYTWYPGAEEWQWHPSLANPLFNFNMLNMPEAGQLLTVGPGQDTQLFIPTNDTWQEHKEMPLGGSYDSSGCLVRIRDDIYQVGTEMLRLNLNDWSYMFMDVVPEFLSNPDRCAPFQDIFSPFPGSIIF